MHFFIVYLSCAIFRAMALPPTSVQPRGFNSSDTSPVSINESNSNQSVTPATATVSIIKQNEFNITKSRLIVGSISDMYKQLPMQLMRGTTQLLDFLWSSKVSGKD
ncbi:hypothetical protein ABG067_006812 [Albugo candida]|uniref:RxLR effector protein n=1 Tax=Albugo candida TaxID=65357 RepID=A0A024FTI9_9STRA|nr:unnamed protein product [Albugo candida]|eukprot:CCI10242.1 unnamed protein product [Albugo candida]